jgi:hypothetical protein
LVCTAAILVCLKIAKRKITINWTAKASIILVCRLDFLLLKQIQEYSSSFFTPSHAELPKQKDLHEIVHPCSKI